MPDRQFFLAACIRPKNTRIAHAHSAVQPSSNSREFRYNADVFSQRSEHSTEKNRLTLLLEQKRTSGVSILDLTGSNPTTAGFQYPGADILTALSSPRSLRYEPGPKGLLDAREAVAEYYGQRGCGVSPDDILLTASTSEAYAYLFKLLADPGTHIHIPRPSYPLFDYLAWAENLGTVPYPLTYDGGWHVDIEGLRHGLSARSRALVAVSPNNPTGSYLKANEWVNVRRLCLLREMPLICDEVFHDYPLDESGPVFEPLLESEALVFVLNGLSKIAGLPQLKLGWIVVAGPQSLKRAALDRLEMIADTFLSVGTPVQLACRELLRTRATVRAQITDRTRSNLSTLREILQGTAAECLRVEGGWYAVVRLPRIRSEEEWALEILETGNVLMHPGYFYDFYDEPFLVLSLLTPPDIFRDGVLHLRALLE